MYLSPNNKVAVLESERKLQELGFDEYIDNLGNEDQEMILNAKTKYFIPWRAVCLSGNKGCVQP